MSNCVSGFDPPGDPNPDCERCQFVTEIARLRGALRYAGNQIERVADNPEWDAVACLRAIAKYARFVATETPKGALTR